MVLTLRVNDKERSLIEQTAKVYGMSMSEFMRHAIFEKLEDEFDLKAYKEAKAEYEKNPVVYTFDEVNEMLGISDDLKG